MFITGTTTLATIYKDKVSTPLANPFTANSDASWLFFALNTAHYDVTMIGGTAPNVFPIPQTLTDLGNGGGGGGGGGGCSTLGIPTTNGSVIGDNTSTNCGYNNRTTDTATVPAEISTFGYNLLDTNSGTDIVAAGVWAGTNNTGDIGVFIGDSAGQNNTGVSVVAIGNQTGIANGGDEVVAIGESAGKNNIASFSNFIGDNSGLINPGQGAAHYEDCMGYDTCRNVDGGGGYFVGIGAFSSSGLHTMHDVIGIGDAAANDRTGGNNIIGIGNGAASGLSDVSPSTGIDIIGIGQGAAGAAVGTGIVGIGRQAGQNTTADFMNAIGYQVCKAMDSGSADIICLGHNITGSGVITNAIGIGSGVALASNSIILGNTDTTVFQVPAVRVGSGIGCLQTDTLGNITNTGAGCGGGGGSGTVTNFSAPGAGWPSWLAPTVANSTTTPSLSVAASPIPNGALANSTLTINTISCTLGGTCTIPSSGAVSSVANSDGTLTISPTTGAVAGSLNLAHANTWTATQTLSGLTLSGITGSTQCLHVSSAGVVSGTGVDCGAGGGGSAWSALTAPTGNLVLSMGANTSSFVYGSATGAVDMFRWLDGASNTGTGILGHFTTASGSTEIPWQADANGVGFKIAPSGALTGVGTSATHGFTLPTATALPTPIATMTGVFSDTSGNLQGYENGGSFSRLCTAGNLQCASSGGGGTPQYIAPQPIAGCGVAYVSALTYTVGACTYSINGVTYNSPLTNITLPAADPTNPEIDVIYVDTTSTVHFIQGAAAVTPQQPVVDPSTQLQLTFVLVPATATTPANTTLVTIFDENTEWTSAKGGTSSANVTLASTNNPYHGTIDTEFGVGGTIATTTYAQYTKPATGTVTLGDYNNLIFYLRNKAAWAKTRSVTVQWFNGATALGTAIVLSNGAYGFDATGNITSYQQVSIPTSAFGIAGTPATTVRFTVTGSGANLTGFYLDLVTLQGGNGGVVLPTTLMNFKGAWTSTATYQPNDTVVGAGIGYVALAQNTNVAVTTSATWAPLAPAATACPTCVTSAAALTNNAVMIGGGSQASSTIGADTTTTHALFATAGAPAFRAIAAGDVPASLSSTTSVNGTTIPSSATLTQTIASGTSALGTSAVSSGACATVVTTSATGTATTDVVAWGFNADPTATTGYQASANGMLTIISYPTAGNVNYKVCNNTGSSITPGAVTLNWRVMR